MKTYTVIMFSTSGCAEISEARRLSEEEKTHYADWFREYGFVQIPGTTVVLENVKWGDIPDRKPDGEFPGCSNRAYIVTAEEAGRYIELNEQRGQKAERDATARRSSGSKPSSPIANDRANCTRKQKPAK